MFYSPLQLRTKSDTYQFSNETKFYNIPTIKKYTFTMVFETLKYASYNPRGFHQNYLVLFSW